MKFAEKMAKRLFPVAETRQLFLDSLGKASSARRAIIWTKDRPPEIPFATLPRQAWQPASVDMLPTESQPGAHPLHESGHYYCLDSSSVFAGSAFCVLSMEALRQVIDVCAAPGGKSILAAIEMHPAQLICNETIAKRTPMLAANLRRCGIEGAEVTKNDPAILAQRFPASADLVIVDAPCSGQSLLAKGKPVPGAFHPSTINMNSNRQKRIIAHSAAMVRPGGYLAYMTCTFSPEENESVIEWLRRKFPEFVPIEVPVLKEFQSPLADFPCYRLWPFQGFGAGAFTALLRRDKDVD